MFLNGYPYTDFHEMNLDFLLKSMEELKKAFASFIASNSLIFAEPMLHDLTSTYAKNTIVLDPDGNAYISLQAVPAGVQLSNADYWLMVFNFEEYTEKANKNFTVNYLRDTTRAPQAYAVGDWLVLDDVLYKVTVAIAADELFDIGTNIVHFTIEQFIKDFVTSVTQTLNDWYTEMTGNINQYKNDIDASEAAFVFQLQQLFDQAISQVTVDSEVVNGRIGWNGAEYTTIGNAIRHQAEANKDMITEAAQTFRTANLFNKYTSLPGAWINNDGTIQPDTGYDVSDYIDISAYIGQSLYFYKDDHYGSGYQCRSMATYDSSKQFVRYLSVVSTFIPAVGEKYVRLCYHDTSTNVMLMRNFENPPTYRPYYRSILSDFETLQDHTGIVATLENPVIEFNLNTPHAWYKFTSIRIEGPNIATYNHVWSYITSDGPNPLWTVASAQGVQNCLFLGGVSNYHLILNLANNQLEYHSGAFSTIPDNCVLLLGLGFNNIVGLLSDCFTTAIEHDWYQHRYLDVKADFLEGYLYSRTASAIQGIGRDIFMFGYMSDTHGRDDMKGYPNLTPKYMNEVDKMLNLDFIYNGGDLIAAANTYSLNDGVKCIVKQTGEIDNLDKLMVALGNHDMNGHTLETDQQVAWTVFHSRFYNATMKQLNNSVVWGSKSDLYYYKDFDDNKIRVIVLNVCDAGEDIVTVDGVDYLKYDTLTVCGVRQAQVNWFVNTALNFSDKAVPTDWHTIILTHIGVRSGITANTPIVQNYNVIDDIIKAFAAGTSVTTSYTDSVNADGLFTTSMTHDFSSQGAMPVIGVFSGHNHCDRVYTTNYPQVTIMAGYPDPGYDNVDREIGTVNEFCFDVVQVNKSARQVALIRFGAGSSRSYSY